MIAGGFHPCQFLSIDTAGILMKKGNRPKLFHDIS